MDEEISAIPSRKHRIHPLTDLDNKETQWIKSHSAARIAIDAEKARVERNRLELDR